jgi:multicomponent Na+:H+ antiporter subunit D
MNLWLLLPLIIPLLTAVVALLAYWSRTTQRWLSVCGAAALLGAGVGLLGNVWDSGIQAAQMGNWPAPYGITLVADLFSAIMVVLTGVIALAVAFYALLSIDAAREHFGFHPLYHFLLMGVCGAFLTGDLFNLYVWFEVMLMASFVLLALGEERPQIEGAIKYVTLNLVSTMIFLTAVGLLYGDIGTLNMADLAQKFSTLDKAQTNGVVTTLAMLFLVAFGIKAAAFPLFFWLPASYHTPPVAITALFSGLLTKVGAYALIRLFTLVFIHDIALTHTLMLVIAGATMITGVLGAVAQYEMRRLLSFHIISQIGYLLMGLGLYSPLALAGAVFFIFHVSVAKTALFLVSGVAERIGGSFELKDLGGLYRSHPGLAILFLIAAMSLAGLPPLSGFFAKLSLVQAGLALEQHAIVAVALGVSLLTLFSMVKIWNEAFWKAPPSPSRDSLSEADENQKPALALWLMPIAFLAAVSIALGLGAGPLFALARRAGEELMQPTGYIRAVLGGAG